METAPPGTAETGDPASAPTRWPAREKRFPFDPVIGTGGGLFHTPLRLPPCRPTHRDDAASGAGETGECPFAVRGHGPSEGDEIPPDAGHDPGVIVADDRERASGIPSLLAVAPGGRVLVARLPLGDYRIGRVTVERKTVTDFLLALSRGRLFPQAACLSRACERPVFLIEGTGLLAPGRWRGCPAAVRGALRYLRRELYLPVVHTARPEKTAEFLLRIFRKEREFPARAPGKRWTILKKTPSPGETALRMLTMIPGIGPAAAHRLLSRYGSLRSLARATANGLRRVPRIGPARAGTIRQAFAENASTPAE
ncbi:MAG: ERCC4 domain-containing protein [Planctomycetota bacterium]